jgi:hypothetical protein
MTKKKAKKVFVNHEIYTSAAKRVDNPPGLDALADYEANYVVDSIEGSTQIEFTCGKAGFGAEQDYRNTIVDGVKAGLLRFNHIAVMACIDMATRYDFDIEGCSGDELLKYGEGISCCFRLAHIIKYGKHPGAGDAWQTEFAELAKQHNEQLRKEGKL